MSMYGVRSQSLGALNSAIVGVLREYGPVPVQLLAKIVGAQSKQIQQAVATLRDRGVVDLQKDTVSLHSETRRKYASAGR